MDKKYHWAFAWRVTDRWARLNVIDEFRYLADVLRRLPTSPPDRLTKLPPEVWFPGHPTAARKRAA